MSAGSGREAQRADHEGSQVRRRGEVRGTGRRAGACLLTSSGGARQQGKRLYVQGRGPARRSASATRRAGLPRRLPPDRPPQGPCLPAGRLAHLGRIGAVAPKPTRTEDGKARNRESRSGWLWHRELAADLAGQLLSNLDVAGNCLNRAGLGVYPERMFAAFTLEAAAVSLQVPEQVTAFHQTRIEVCSAPLGAFSSPCSRR
jgi:hypothetical protein